MHAEPGETALQTSVVPFTSHFRVQRPLPGPPVPRAVLAGVKHVRPSAQSAFAVQTSPTDPGAEAVGDAPESPPLPVPLAPARPAAPALPVPPLPAAPAVISDPPPLPPPVASSLPQLAVAATVPTDSVSSVNQVRALITEAS